MQNNYLQFFDNAPDTLLITENKQIRNMNVSWGNGKTKNDVPTDILSQERRNPLARGEKTLENIQPGV